MLATPGRLPLGSCSGMPVEWWPPSTRMRSSTTVPGAPVAHARPGPVLGTASVGGLLPDGVSQGPDGRLRVPSAALSVLELGVSQSGVPCVGFFAQVPHYLSAAYPQAAIELLGHVGR